MGRPRPPAPASRRQGSRRPEGSNMADRASNRPDTKYVLGHSDREARGPTHQAALPKLRQKRIQTFPAGLARVVTMSRITLVTTLVGSLAVGALVAAPAGQVFQGR